ncbi:hypothetical protein [Allorhodopirellula solitaria]|uniref:Macro domain-containing protein n=1 Tax=Allorhodopirellula solitaria TaxID=2527987 RepID=A0A5C5YJI8_9BACT|nr:hypothetical protein [Allorhodopirellula solitaria]TWT75054.1 hypothetical protein CA85_03420 [Allorhodopirellula solitaria]
MTWFQRLTGTGEDSPTQIRAELSVRDDCLVCPGGQRIAFGRLETPRLSELRDRVSKLTTEPICSTIQEVVADVRRLHADQDNAGAVFQVASQFNLLEMTGPSVTPERGVGIYENDPTQGPACAIACGAGTIYRNYFAPVVDSTVVRRAAGESSELPGGASTSDFSECVLGQTANHQIDCSADLGSELGNTDQRLWTMQNGYLFPTDDGLAEIAQTIRSASPPGRESLLGLLRIGLQIDAEVTIADGRDQVSGQPASGQRASGHRVSQAYCSALPVAYGRQPTEQWADFAKLILDAAYEATLAAAVLNAIHSGNRVVYLTLLGGGVFGNRDQWIIDAIERAFGKHVDHNLDVRIVSYGHSKPAVAELVRRLQNSG